MRNFRQFKQTFRQTGAIIALVAMLFSLCLPTTEALAAASATSSNFIPNASWATPGGKLYEYTISVPDGVDANDWVNCNYTAYYGMNSQSTPMSYVSAVGVSINIGGQYATAMGYSTYADMKSTAIGNTASASGFSSVAVGDHANTNGSDSVAIGARAGAKNNYTVAVGGYSKANGSYAVAVGYESESHENSVALGRQSYTSGTFEVSVGNNSITRKITHVTDGSVSSGSHDAVTGGQLYTKSLTSATLSSGTLYLKNAASSNLATVSLTGLTTTQGNTNATNITNINSRLNNTKLALGSGATAAGNNAVALGTSANAAAENSFAFGGTVGATHTGSVALGYGSTTNGANQVSVGNGTTNRKIVNVTGGDLSSTSTEVVVGSQLNTEQQARTTADMALSNRIGTVASDGTYVKTTKNVSENLTALDTAVVNETTNRTNADTTLQTNITNEATARTNADTAINNRLNASKLMLGQSASATGDNSTALGYNATGTGTNSVAIGYNASATGVNSVAIGSNSVVSGNNELSVGSSTQKRSISNVAAIEPESGGSYAATTGQVYNATLSGVSLGSDNKTLKVSENGSFKTVDLSALQTTQGTTNAANIQTNTTNITALQSKMGTFADGSYVKAAKTAGENFTALDTQVKTNTEAIATKSSKAETVSTVSFAGGQLKQTTAAGVTTDIATLTDSALTNATLNGKTLVLTTKDAYSGAETKKNVDLSSLETETKVISDGVTFKGDGKNVTIQTDVATKTSTIKLTDELSDLTSITTIADGLGGKTTFSSSGLTVSGGASALSATQLKVGNSLLTTDSLTVGGLSYISSEGLNANNKKITNVADGELSSVSLDAVNARQLYATNEKVAANETKIAENKAAIETNTAATAAKADKTEAVKAIEITGTGELTQTTAAGSTTTIAQLRDSAVSTASLNGKTLKITSTDSYTGATTIQSVDLSALETGTQVITGGVTFQGDENIAIETSGTTSTIKLASNITNIEAIATKTDPNGNNTTVTTNGLTIKQGTATAAVYSSTRAQVGSSALTTDTLTVGGTDYITSAGINAGNNKITGVANGTDATDAATYGQLTSAINSEATARQSADTALDSKITAETTRAETVENEIIAKVGTVTDGNIVQASKSQGANINAIDTKVGAVTDGVFVKASNTFAENINSLDATIQTIRAKGTDAITAVKYDATDEAAKVNANGALASGYNSQANGEKSLAYGYGAVTDGENSVSIGDNTKAKGDSSMALGNDVTAKGTNNIAMGVTSSTTGNNAVAIGAQNCVSGNSSMALGSETQLSGEKSVALGTANCVSGNSSMALGNSAKVEADSAVALGNSSQAKAENAFAAGTQAEATGKSSIAMGTNTKSKGENAMAYGNSVTAEGKSNVAMGDGAYTKGDNAIAVGTANCVSGNSSMALGNSAKVEADSAVALGNSSQAKAENAFAAGTQAEASGKSSIALGENAKAAAEGSVVVGGAITDKSGATKPSAVSPNSTSGIAIGNGTTVGYKDGTIGSEDMAAENSIGIGYNTTVTGNNSIAVGTGHIVTGNKSGAFGDPNVVTGTGSYAMGNDNEIIGNNSYTIGNNNKVAANNTFVLGSNVTTSAQNAVVLGNGSTATRDNSVSVGAAGAERQITNVAAGTVYTDAANMGQLWGVEKEGRQIAAMSAALAGLHYMEPSGEGNDRVTGAVAYGGYRGENAAAVGIAYKPNPDMMFSAATSIGNDQQSYNAGMSFRLGKGRTVTRTELAKQIKYVNEENEKLKKNNEALHNTVMSQSADIKAISEENAQLKGTVEQQGEQIQQLLEAVKELQKRSR